MKAKTQIRIALTLLVLFIASIVIAASYIFLVDKEEDNSTSVASADGEPCGNFCEIENIDFDFGLRNFTRVKVMSADVYGDSSEEVIIAMDSTNNGNDEKIQIFETIDGTLNLIKEFPIAYDSRYGFQKYDVNDNGIEEIIFSSDQEVYSILGKDAGGMPVIETLVRIDDYFDSQIYDVQVSSYKVRKANLNGDGKSDLVLLVNKRVNEENNYGNNSILLLTQNSTQQEGKSLTNGYSYFNEIEIASDGDELFGIDGQSDLEVLQSTPSLLELIMLSGDGGREYSIYFKSADIAPKETGQNEFELKSYNWNEPMDYGLGVRLGGSFKNGNFKSNGEEGVVFSVGDRYKLRYNGKPLNDFAEEGSTQTYVLNNQERTMFGYQKFNKEGVDYDLIFGLTQNKYGFSDKHQTFEIFDISGDTLIKEDVTLDNGSGSFVSSFDLVDINNDGLKDVVYITPEWYDAYNINIPPKLSIAYHGKDEVIEEPEVDLSVGNIKVNKISNRYFTVDFEVQNNSNTAVNNIVVNAKATGKLEGDLTFTVDSIAAETSRKITKGFRTTAQRDNRAQIRITVDPQNKIAETNERNNEAKIEQSLSIVSTGGGVIRPPEAPTEVDPGELNLQPIDIISPPLETQQRENLTEEQVTEINTKVKEVNLTNGFEGENTTKLEDVEGNVVDNLVLEKQNTGAVQYLSPIVFETPEEVEQLEEATKSIVISKNKVSIDSAKFAKLNAPAKLTVKIDFKVRSVEYLDVLRDGEVVTDKVDNLQYDRDLDVVSFIVDGFSEYEVVRKQIESDGTDLFILSSVLVVGLASVSIYYIWRKEGKSKKK